MAFPGDPTSRICVECKSQIDLHATRCPYCQSFQGMRRYVNNAVPFAALIVAAVAVFPAIVYVLNNTVWREGPKVTVLSFFAENPVDLRGNLITNGGFSISAQVSSLDTDRLILGDSLTCFMRDAVFAKSETRSLETQDPSVVIVSEALFDMYLYFENKARISLAPEAEVQATWSLQNSISLEYYGADYQTKVYGAQDAGLFYNEVLSHLQAVADAWPEVEFPRSASQDEEGNFKGFFANIDCNFTVEDANGYVSQELHLELLYEHAGDDGGTYPRWSIGKNIGFGAGNGAGS